MKRMVIFLLICFLLAGCRQEQKAETTQIGNPWVSYDSLADAAEAAGCSLPGQVADFTAQAFRVMSSELLEVVYRDDSGCEITIRKACSEDPDISGDYNSYPSVQEEVHSWGTVTYKVNDPAVLTLFSFDGYAYSLSAPEGYPGDTAQDFLHALTGQ